MHEIVSIALDNEMDLILAHKRTMKLAELCGLSTPAQTIFATAVSEIARHSIAHGDQSSLTLNIEFTRTQKFVCASLLDAMDLSISNPEAMAYARKLVGNVELLKTDEHLHEIRLKQLIPMGGTISLPRIQQFKEYFKTEPPLSPYDEIRKKNLQLIDLTYKLRASENQYRTLTDTLPLIMFSMNLQGDISYANKGLSSYFEAGTPLTSTTLLSLFHPDDYMKVAAWNKTHGIFRTQARLRHPATENHLWHLVTILPQKSEQGQVTGYIGFFVDIHAQKLVEETLKDNQQLREAQHTLKRYQEELESKIQELNISNHDLEQFAYIASHDLQEPLRKIKTFGSLLHKTVTFTPEEQRYFDKMILSSDRMSMLIRDVLAYSRLSRPDEKSGKTDLNDLLAQLTVDFELLIQDTQAKITIDPLPVVTGISTQFNQLFSNLLSNALKFATESPAIHIYARIVDAPQLAHLQQYLPFEAYHEISVQDNGIGFEQQFSEQIFTIFQRLNAADSYSGTGIGLALCKKIVGNHQGFIIAESAPEAGAVFRVYLPVA